MKRKTEIDQLRALAKVISFKLCRRLILRYRLKSPLLSSIEA